MRPEIALGGGRGRGGRGRMRRGNYFDFSRGEGGGWMLWGDNIHAKDIIHVKGNIHVKFKVHMKVNIF